MKDLVWVVCWRRRGPALPVVGPPAPAGGKPPVAWYLAYERGRGGWAWSASTAKARRFGSRAEAERVRADANATRTAAVCCVNRLTLERLDPTGKDG